MDTKLTLSINKDIIDAAKELARKRNTSLSNLIENYLVNITRQEKGGEEDISPLVKSLSGVLKPDNTTDRKKQYADYLSNKYK